MGSKMLIDASHPEETRVVVIKGNRIEEFDFESAARKQLKGNIYLAKVTRVEPSLQAAFVEYGGNRHGFLAFSEIHPDYYQIPLADRMALLEEEEEEHARESEREDEEGERAASGSRNHRRDRSRDNRRRNAEANAEQADESAAQDSRPESEEAAEISHEAQDFAEQAEASAEAAATGEESSAAGGTEAAEAQDSHEPPEDESQDSSGELPEDSPGPGEGTPRAEPLAATHKDDSLSEDVEPDEDEDGDDEEDDGDGDDAIADASSESDDGPNDKDDTEAPPEAIAPVPSAQHGMPAELGNGIEEVGEDPEAQKVESIGAEDALEEVPQRKRRTPRRQYKIQEVIKRRQVILVQVVKEERGNKGAALTTYLSLAGRYCVLMPNTARGGGISRKITDSGDRRRLKEVAKEIEVPQGMGLIVRTAGAQRTKTEIKRDYDYLLRLWESVRDLTLKSQAPALVYEEGSLVKRAIRDLYTKDVDEVMVEGDNAYREAKDFMKMLMPSHAKNVKPYKDARPLFSRYQAESQLDGLYTPTVTLPSGGYMVINQTEALVSVDINSGKATREHNIEDTALKTNLEAADEIARQLRLRDLAGLVVIDFIDMEEKRNNRNVERRLKDALKNDRARIQVGHISHFGLLEMSRQRLRPGLLEGSSRTCPHCEGRGIVRSVSSCGLSVLRAIEEHLIARKPENLTVKCTREIAFYILNEKRDNLLAIETAYGISVFIVPSDDLKGSQAVIERAPDRNIPPRKVLAAPVRIDSAFETDEEDEPGNAEAEPDEEDAEESGEDGGEESGERLASQNGERSESGRKRRRRRGRRGGRGREDMADSEGQFDNNGVESPEANDIPGLGDQPVIAIEDETAGEGEATEETAEAAAGSTETGDAPAAREDGRRDDRRRRDRGGRNRDRNREYGGRGERQDEPERTERPVAVDAEPEKTADAVPLPPAGAAAPVSVMEPEAPVEPPRRWQPPAPTVDTQPAERKSGWWSKRS